MLFNSVDYLIFFPIVVTLYFIFPVKWRWLFLLIASYCFYMSWKIEYGVLLLFTTLVDFFAALKMGKASSRKEKKVYLLLSIIANLGMLAGFKYLNFFTGSINLLFSEINILYTFPAFSIVLPVGISFFVFQSMSYSIDVYRGIRPPEKHAGKYALYVSFFPQLVAGPIERSTHLLPQTHLSRPFDTQRLVSGLKLMLWGYFKKVVIADRLGMFVGYVYDNPSEHNGLPVILATVLFAFQLYCDFSAYTDIARGSARILGYDLMINFNRPLIARSLRDFWNRWHISLTSWFRDYVFYSMPYIKNKKVIYERLYINLIVTYLLMGLWHGADWTFVIFGLINGVMLVIETLTEKQRKWFYNLIRISQSTILETTLGLLGTASVITFSLFFFRANSMSDSILLLSNAVNFTHTGETLRALLRDNELLFGILMIVVLFVAEYVHEKHNLVRILASKPLIIRWSVYAGFVFFILIFGVLQKQKFIYFQF